MSDNKKTFWPYGILLSIIACIVACGYTIYVCLDYPVHIDNGRFASYQEVDYKINDIEDAQAAFEAAFGKAEIEFFANGVALSEEMKLRKKRVVKVGEFGSKFSALIKTGAKDGQITAFLTRPETSVYDRPLNATFSEQGVKIEDFEVEKKGRWQIKIKIDAGENKIGVYSFEFFAK